MIQPLLPNKPSGVPRVDDRRVLIGRARATPHVFYALGHGHLGLTQSTGTARIVADLLTGQTPPIDIVPFSILRF